MNRQQEIAILKLWRQWCSIWPAHYGHEYSVVESDGYDPVFDVIPAQMYIDFYHDVTRRHEYLCELNIFEVVDTALNQTRAPETLTDDALALDVAATMQASDSGNLPLPVVTVELEEIANPDLARQTESKHRRRAKKADKVGVKKSA